MVVEMHRIEECCDIHLMVSGIKCFDCRFQDRGIATEGYDISTTQPCTFCISEEENCYWESTEIKVL